MFYNELWKLFYYFIIIITIIIIIIFLLLFSIRNYLLSVIICNYLSLDFVNLYPNDFFESII